MEKARNCLTIDEIHEGMSFTREYTVTQETVEKFADVTGDWNPVHIDAEFARKTVFRKQIAHGMLSISQFSTIFGMDMPGLGVIWLSQSANFLAPVYLDVPHTAVATATKVDAETGSVTFSTECFNEAGKKVMEGEGILKPIPAKVKAKLADIPV